MNLLFICSRNLWRSPTAEAIYKTRAGITAQSAGTAPSARIKLTANLILWADLIFLMEKKHRQRLTEKFPAESSEKEIIVLGIPDEYSFMDAELISELEAGINPYLVQ